MSSEGAIHIGTLRDIEAWSRSGGEAVKDQATSSSRPLATLCSAAR